MGGVANPKVLNPRKGNKGSFGMINSDRPDLSTGHNDLAVAIEAFKGRKRGVDSSVGVPLKLEITERALW